jgi:hypothetical protein
MQLLPLCGVKQQFSPETMLQRHAIAFPAEAVAEDTRQVNDKKAIYLLTRCSSARNSPAVSRSM